VDGRACVYRTYRYRIYPTRRQRLILETHLQFACDLYNAALEQRRYEWRAGRPIGFASQCRQLTDIWSAGDGPPGMRYSTMQDPLRRLDRSFQNFVRRVTAGQTPGYPRYRSRLRYDVLTWSGSWVIENRRLALPGIGHLKVKWHRGLPTAGSRRILTVRRHADRWYACIVLALPVPLHRKPATGPAVGVDLGIQNFAALSTGELIPGPRAFRTSSKRLRTAQRRVSRRVQGSGRRQKAGLVVARLHDRIRNIRRNHAHQLSRRLTSEFALIAVEDLVLRDLAGGIIAKDVRDQAWGQFLRLLGYKAEDAGVQVVRVAPARTSKVCSGCGTSVVKPLSERQHRCPECDLVIDRDVNAARNILRLGTSRQASTWALSRA
jgi:putative transposase